MYEITLDGAKWEFEEFEILPGVLVLKNCRDYRGDPVRLKLVPVTDVLDIREKR